MEKTKHHIIDLIYIEEKEYVSIWEFSRLTGLSINKIHNRKKYKDLGEFPSGIISRMNGLNNCLGFNLRKFYEWKGESYNYERETEIYKRLFSYEDDHILNFTIDFEPITILWDYDIMCNFYDLLSKFKRFGNLSEFAGKVKKENFVKRLHEYIMSEKKSENYRESVCPPFNKEFWQIIIDFVCELLGKTKRHVHWMEDFEGTYKLNGYIYEYLSDAYNKGAYFIETEIHKVNNFYERAFINDDDYWQYEKYNDNREWDEILKPHKIEQMKNARFEILKGTLHNHYMALHKYLIIQGILSKNAYYKPDTKTIELLIKKIKNYGKD